MKKSLYIMSVFEGIPDFFIFVSLQVAVVYIYKQTNILLFNFVSIGDDKLYFLPILFLSILPTAYLYRLMIESYIEEEEKAYVELASGKGLSKSRITLLHILRNTIPSLMNNIKPIVWMILSNLLIVEYIFNLNGITMFIYHYLTPEILVVSMFLVYVPLYLFILLCKSVFNLRGVIESDV